MHEATFDHGKHQGLASCIAYDPRADGKRRTVLLGERYVVIRRRLHGVKMHVAIPFENYRGIEIAHADDPAGRQFRLSLVHRDPDLCVAIIISRDEAGVTNALRHWAARFAAPGAADAIMEPEPKGASASGAHSSAKQSESVAAGCLQTGEPVALRSCGFARARRKLSPVKRQRGRTSRRAPIVFRGEREIICYE
jgi:hypothetical protein